MYAPVCPGTRYLMAHSQPPRPGRLMSLHDEFVGRKRRKATERRIKEILPYAASTHFSFALKGTFFFPNIRDCFLRKTSKNCEKSLREKATPCFVCRALFPVRIRVAAALRSSETNLWEFGSLANEAGDTDAAKSSKLFFPSISSSSSSSSSSQASSSSFFFACFLTFSTGHFLEERYRWDNPKKDEGALRLNRPQFNPWRIVTFETVSPSKKEGNLRLYIQFGNRLINKIPSPLLYCKLLAQNHDHDLLLAVFALPVGNFIKLWKTSCVRQRYPAPVHGSRNSLARILLANFHRMCCRHSSPGKDGFKNYQGVTWLHVSLRPWARAYLLSTGSANLELCLFGLLIC